MGNKQMKNCPKSYEEKDQGIGWELLEVVWRANLHIWWSEKASLRSCYLIRYPKNGRGLSRKSMCGDELALLVSTWRLVWPGHRKEGDKRHQRRLESWAESIALLLQFPFLPASWQSPQPHRHACCFHVFSCPGHSSLPWVTWLLWIL